MSVRATGAAMLNLALHVLHPLPIAPHNIPNMSNPIKIYLQLINLPQDLVEAGNLGISSRNRIARPVVLLLRHHLRLLREVVQPRLNLLQQAVEVAPERRERRAVEQQQPL